MKIFANQELATLKQRATELQWKEILDNERATIANIISKPIITPSNEIQTRWTHKFICPSCNGALIFNINDSKKHQCSLCGEYTEDIKDDYTLEGCWHKLLNNYQIDNALNVARMGAIDDNQEMLNYAKDMLLTYTYSYADMKEHGEAAGTGKLQPQSLCEAVWILPACAIWRILTKLNFLSEQESQDVCDLMFQPAIDLLVRQTSNIHNIHVWHAAAIASAALACNNKHALNFAKKIINKNIEKGILNGGMWYEIAVGYHYYTLMALLSYECALAENNLVSDHKLDIESMLYAPLDLVLPDGNFPLINDGGMSNNIKSKISIYETANALYSGFEEINKMLHSEYDANRKTFKAFLSGCSLSTNSSFQPKQITVTDGLCMVRHEKFITLLKASPNAGGHDHPDRISLNIYMPDNKMFAGDLGNPGYGSPYHTRYFKTTCAHNTFMIDDENQNNSDGHIGRTVHLEEFSFVSSHDDGGAYSDVLMRRNIIVGDDWIIDLAYANSKNEHKMNWLFHAKGDLYDDNDKKMNGESYKFIPNEYIKEQKKFALNSWSGYWLGQDEDKTKLNVEVCAYGDNPIIGSASCPNLPTTQFHDCLIAEVNDKNMTVATIFSREGAQIPEVISCENENIKFKLPNSNKTVLIGKRQMITFSG
ncbi:MAG: heparinase II/III family protein [Kiritimatiellae bacterium]|jgi:hypothetical protein|nr:heparinase II/III family protein [Kiritimatiellia bacterium]